MYGKGSLPLECLTNLTYKDCRAWLVGGPSWLGYGHTGRAGDVIGGGWSEQGCPWSLWPVHTTIQ